MQETHVNSVNMRNVKLNKSFVSVDRIIDLLLIFAILFSLYKL